VTQIRAIPQQQAISLKYKNITYTMGNNPSIEQITGMSDT